MSDSFPVTVAVRRPDGSSEEVRVGTATRTADGFRVTLDTLSIPTEATAAPRAGARAAPPRLTGAEPMVFPNYGRSKGLPIAGASQQDLEFYANGARRTLADSSKARFHDKERALLAVIEAELARHGGAGGPADDSEIPPPTDADRGPDDAPF